MIEKIDNIFLSEITAQENPFNTDQEQMSLDDFVIQNKIGYGSFGKVYKVRAKKSREIYEAKISHNRLVDSSPEMKKKSHSSIIKWQ